ncbi:MAG: penicillin acylase family protein [Motilibacteraceae bacterium]
MRRTVVTLVSATALVVGGAGAAATSVASAPSGAVHVRGLQAPASVSRDVQGIAHVRARTEHDLFFLNGWVHAGDRLFQMDLSRRQPSGTSAELLGPSALPGDVQARTIGLRRAAERSLPLLAPGTRADLQAYADGVNAWVRTHPGLTPEYAALKLRSFAPWTPLDSVTISKAISFELSFDLDTGNTTALQAYLAAGAAKGFDGRALFSQDTWRVKPFTLASTVPDATAARAPARSRARALATTAPGMTTDVQRMAGDWQARLEGSAPFLREAVTPQDQAGSNEWGISGRLSVTGRPMVANDPHLALGMPSTFYPIHLTAGSIDVTGSGFPGTPGVILGHNAHVSWGATTNPMDVTDTFAEKVVADPTSPSKLSTVYQGRLEHVVPIPETYKVNQGGTLVPVPPSEQVPATTLIVPRRNNGPIVSLTAPTAASPGSGLSVQYTGFSGTRELDTFLGFDRARSLADFQRALTFFDVGSQNFAYADDHGNLAYFTSAEMPLREDLQAGKVNGLPPWFVRNGQGGNEWLPATHHFPGQAIPYEILPPQEMPHVVNPRAGFFVNANNDPAGTNLDNDPIDQLRPGGGIYYLNAGYDGFRAGRITEMIRDATRGGHRLSMGDLERMQADVTQIDAEVLLPYLLSAYRHASASSTPQLAALAKDPRVRAAVGRLAAWDRATPTGIVQGYDASDVNGRRLPPSAAERRNAAAATIYAMWRSRALANTVDATLARVGLKSVLPPGDAAMADLRHLLDTFPTAHGVGASGLDFFAVPGVGSSNDRRDVVLLTSLSQALTRLASPDFAAAFGGSTNQADYLWGKLHRHVFTHPLGGAWNVPPAAGFTAAVPGLPGVSVDGGFGVVDASNHDPRADSVNGFMFGGGPVQRFVSAPAPGRTRTVNSTPGGTSGILGNPRYANLLPKWLTDDYYPQLLSEPGLRGTLVTTQTYRP